MYQYSKGYIFREGNDRIPSNLLRKLYQSVNWIPDDMPVWLNEKFEIALKNSTWAFTVWDKENLIGMVRVISDKVMIATIQDLIVHPKYQRCGIGIKLINLCLNKLPAGKWFAHTTSNNYSFYEKAGFIKPKKNSESTLVFDGFKKAKEDKT